MSEQAQLLRRPRGRPPLSEAAVGQVRSRLLRATRTVFARVGYHGLTVELVIAEAGVSRPTFYKYFSSMEAAVERLVAEVNQDIIDRLMAALATSPDLMTKIEAGILAWKQWGEDLGEFLGPFYTELHDRQSPVGRQRQLTLGLLEARIAEVVVLLGRAAPSPLRVKAFIHGVEFLGYHYHLNTPRDAQSWAETRDAIFRMAIGLLGDAADWGNALGLARDFPIDLAPA